MEPITRAERTSAAPAEPKPRRRRRAVLLLVGALLAALDAVWMTGMEVMWNQGYATLISLYYHVVFSLVVLLAVNALLRRLWPRVALTRGELLLLFVAATIGASVAMMTEYLTAVLPFSTHFANLDERWQHSLAPHLPHRLMVEDAEAARAFFTGTREPWVASLWRPWLGPFLGWGALILAVTWVGVCLSALTYTQLRQQERMPFPLTQIPLLMTDRRASFTSSPAFWIGFALAAGVDLLNALSAVNPLFPALPVKRQTLVLPGLTRPWASLSLIPYSLNPFLVGLEYFLPTDLLFSLFFFYWVGRLQAVVIDWLGSEVQFAPYEMVAPYVREQAVGALLALLLFALWASRGRWREAWAQLDESFLSRQSALYGALGGGAAIWIGLVLAGMPWALAAGFLLLYLALIVSLSRIRAQYGPPSTGLLLAAPGPVLYSLLGRDNLGPGGLTSLAVTHWWGREFSGHPMPATLESFALSDRAGVKRSLVAFVVVGALAGYVAAFATTLGLGLHYGHATSKLGGTQFYFGNEAYQLFSKRLSDPVGGPHWDSLAAIGAGGGVTLLLQALRTRLIAFPLHPVGYAIASTYTSTFIWSTALITWVVKSVLLRYTGLKGYYRAAPFFLGLLLGEFVVGSLLSLLGMLIGTNLYVFWPY